jgi:hypothetical protein
MGLLEKANRGGTVKSSASKRGFFARAAAARVPESEEEDRHPLEAPEAPQASPEVEALVDMDSFSEYETFDDQEDYPGEEYVAEEDGLFEVPPLPEAEGIDEDESFFEPEPIAEPDLVLEAEAPSERPTRLEEKKHGIEGLESIRASLRGLPSAPDRLLSVWRFLYEKLPLGAYAVLLRSEDFLAIAANSGFPLGAVDSIPSSLARVGLDAVDSLEPEDAALLAPILGLKNDLPLRASSMLAPDGEPFGLWILYDESLASLDRETLAELGSLLASAAGPEAAGFTILRPVPEPARELLSSISSFNSAVAFAFDLSELMADSEAQVAYLRSISPETARSAFVSSCSMLLRHGGTALPYGRHSVGCAMGCSGPADPELAFFQFTKTLRRAAPFLSSVAFPKGRYLSVSTSSEGALDALADFLAE